MSMRRCSLIPLLGFVLALVSPALSAEPTDYPPQVTRALETYAGELRDARAALLQAYDDSYEDLIRAEAFDQARTIWDEHAAIAFRTANPRVQDRLERPKEVAEARATFNDATSDAKERLIAVVEEHRGQAAQRGDANAALRLNSLVDQIENPGTELLDLLPLTRDVQFVRYLGRVEEHRQDPPDELECKPMIDAAKIEGFGKHDVATVDGVERGHFGKAIVFDGVGWSGWMTPGVDAKLVETRYWVALLDRQGKKIKEENLELKAGEVLRWSFRRNGREAQLVIERPDRKILVLDESVFRARQLAIAATVRQPGDEASLTVTFRAVED